MNILLTSSCNRRCPYCFAAERISYRPGRASKRHQAPPFIAGEDFETAIEFARAGKQRRVGILGGEPSLHPDFPALLQVAWAAGVDTNVFTNGLWPAKHLDAVAEMLPRHAKRFSATVNVNHPSLTPDKERERQETLLRRLGRHCTLSFNVFQEDFDATFLLELITRFRLRRHIRLGIAQPLAEQSSEFVAVPRYAKLAEGLMQLAAAADERNVTVGFDCGFTLCMFTAEQLGRLHLAGCRFRASCGPAIDVGTDLAVWACFPLSTLQAGERLSDFENLEALGAHFRTRFRRLYRAGTMDECADCRYLARRQCSGGCAAHVYREVQP